MGKLFFCSGCSFKCQASDCDCVCHTDEWQLGFVAGQKQVDKDIKRIKETGGKKNE